MDTTGGIETLGDANISRPYSGGLTSSTRLSTRDLHPIDSLSEIYMQSLSPDNMCLVGFLLEAHASSEVSHRHVLVACLLAICDSRYSPEVIPPGGFLQQTYV